MKTLRHILDGVPCSWNGLGDFTIPIRQVHSDSREIKPGDLFVAVSGLHVDGLQYVTEAIQRGAKAIVSERFDPVARGRGLPQFVVANARAVLSRLVASAYGFPAQKLKCIGITGTNGKTTTAFLIHYLLSRASRTGLIGSIFYDDGKTKRTAGNTTPVPEVLNEHLARMVEQGVSYCVMEVSSHALDQYRAEGIRFSSAVFTNLTQDHLDYHKDFEAYYRAKRRLFFNDTPPERAIINGDDAYGSRLLDELIGRNRTVSYGLKGRRDYLAQGVQFHSDRICFDLLRTNERISATAPLLLRHNVYNVLAALSTVCEEGIPIEEVIPSLVHFAGVPGRMERIDEGQDFHVFVDYAHTPDGLFNVLSSLDGLSKGRVISVFGCGGDRDRAKRPQMGEITSRFSDFVILTNDNPRSEEPDRILEDIKKGIRGVGKRAEVMELVDRGEAIRKAIGIARSGDMVFIFGKGHENYQVFNKERVPFSDQEVARHWLKLRCSRSAKLQKLAMER